MDEICKYHIKVISRKKKIYNNERYTEVLCIERFANAEAFKQGYKELLKKYGNYENEIFTYQKIRGSWYECPNPKIQV